MKEPKPLVIKPADMTNLHPGQSIRRLYRYGAKPPVYHVITIKKQTNVDRFYEWLIKCGNVHLSNDEQVVNAFNKIPI